jgi:phosphatidylserine synthase 2
VGAALAVGLIFCAEHLRDTLFIRPHPAIWRFVTGVGLFYAMFLTFLLFQRIETVRTIIMPFLDPAVTGQPLKERSYGDDCALTWDNVKV